MAENKEKAAETKAAETPQTPTIDLEAIKAQIKAELLADMQKENPAGAAPVSIAVNNDLEEYVEVQLFKDGKDYKDDVFVSVNGENCVIKRGMPVRIKKKFALVLEASQAQDIRAAEYAEQQQREFNSQVKFYNI